MALMQLGIFAAIPLVQQREKLILKRLNATPLPRWTLVGSNVIVRLLIAAAQTAIIIGIGFAVLGVEIVGNWARDRRLRRARRADVHVHRLRHRLVREDRGGGERDDAASSSSR